MAQMSMDDFNVGVTLGTGSFGRVRFAVEKVSYAAHVRVLPFGGVE